MSTSLSDLERRLIERLEHLEWLESIERQLVLETTAQIAEYTSLQQHLRDETHAHEIHQFLLQKSIDQTFLL